MNIYNTRKINLESEKGEELYDLDILNKKGYLN